MGLPAKLGLSLFVLLCILGTVPLLALGSGLYRSFYIPAEAMMPTLRVQERILARMHAPSQLERGMIVLFVVNGDIWIKRVAALPGDRIEILDGVPILNGTAVEQRRIGEERIHAPEYGNRAVRLVERFPGEGRTHHIFDLGLSRLDNMAEQEVAQGHLFVLGDNRDMSADSRLPRDEGGVGQLPIADLRGTPWLIWGSPHERRAGTRLDR